MRNVGEESYIYIDFYWIFRMIDSLLLFRDILRGGGPGAPGVPSYPNNPYWDKFLNKLMFVEKMSAQECKNFFGCDHQKFYELRSRWVDPLYNQGAHAHCIGFYCVLYNTVL